MITLNTSEELIVRYETTRRLIRDLNAKRMALVDSCSKEGMTEESRPFTNICLRDAYQEWAQGFGPEGDIDINFLAYCKELNGEGELCDSCYESIRIKRTDLAEAKQEFGNIKRALVYVGSNLIKQVQA